MDSEDEYVSLNSTEDEGEDGKAYTVEDVLAEKHTPDGRTLWLVSWDGYDSDYHMWLPEENFDDPGTLQEWEVRKQGIREGRMTPYNWKRWERKQEAMKLQKAKEKEERQAKREIKRAQLGATKRKGEWTLPRHRHRVNDGKRSRSTSDDTYSEDRDDEDEIRPSKRKVVSESDSEDDIPLASLLAKHSTPAAGDIMSPSLRTAFSLPIRSSQSPFPPERPSVGLPRPVESSRDSDNLISGSALGQPVVEATTSSSVRQPIGLTSSATNITSASTKAGVPRPKATAVRSSIPKSQHQHIFNIPKRVVKKKSRTMSHTQNLAAPTSKDFYSKVARHWNHPPVDRDARQPDTSNMTIMDISTAAQKTSVPSYKRGMQSAPNTPIAAQAPIVTASSSVADPGGSRDSILYRHDTFANKQSDDPARRIKTAGRTKVNQPFIEDSPNEEPSLFVPDSQDAVMEDASIETSLPAPNLTEMVLEHSGERQNTNVTNPAAPASINHTITIPLAQDPAKSASMLKTSQTEHQTANRHNSTDTSRQSTAMTNSSRSLTTVIHLNGAYNLTVGCLESLDTHGKDLPTSNSPPTYVQLMLKDQTRIYVQIKNFRSIDHHELLQLESRSMEQRILLFQDGFVAFGDFLSKYERKDEHMFFTAGHLEPNFRKPQSKVHLSKIMDGMVFAGRFVSLLIWPVSNPAWNSATNRFVRSNLPTQFGVIMFRTAAADPQPKSIQGPTSVLKNAAPSHDKPARNTLYLSAPGLQAVNLLYAKPIPLEQKESALKQIFNSPEAFSQDMTREQKASLFKALVKALPLATGNKAYEGENTSEAKSPGERPITEPAEDPRTRRRSGVMGTDIPAAIPSLPPDKSAFSFSAFHKKFMAQRPHTRRSAIKIFKENLDIDWRDMTSHEEPIVYAFIQYPPKVVPEELDVLKEFLHSVRAREYDSKILEHWDAFQSLVKPKTEHYGKNGTRSIKEHFDAGKHQRVTTGSHGVILIHESTSIPESFTRQLVKSLQNPNLRMFRITLGQTYVDRNAVDVKPIPAITELAKEGEHVLLTDSVIIKRPQEALDMLRWLSIKLDSGDPQLWKIYGRPKLSRWIADLVLANEDNEARPGLCNVYSEIYAWLEKLVPEHDRDYRYDDEWIPLSTSALRTEIVLPGYDYAIGTDTTREDLDADLDYNDKILVTWFGKVTQPIIEEVRFFTAVFEEPEEFGQKMTGEWKHIRFYPTEWFTTAYVRSTLLADQWKKEKGIAT